MCNMLVHLLLACVVFTIADVGALPTLLKDGDKVKEGDSSNKTSNTIAEQKSASHPTDKSVRSMVVPVYPQFVSPTVNMPFEFQRPQMPYVPPQMSTNLVRNPSYVHRQPVRLTNGYGVYRPDQVIVEPMPHKFKPASALTSPFPQQIYEQPAVVPPSYNFAPYPPNSYVMYGSRSAVDDEQKLASLTLGEQPQYAVGGYILNPHQIEYQIEQPSTLYVNDEYSSIPNSEYSSEGMEPRHVRISVDPSHEDLSHVSSDTTDQVYYEIIDPYASKLVGELEQQPHFHHVNYRVTGERPAAHLSMAKPYVNSESMNWIWPRGDYPFYVM